MSSSLIVGHPVEVMITPVHGSIDPPRFSITFKVGTKKLRVLVDPEKFALALSGRLVEGVVDSNTLL